MTKFIIKPRGTGKSTDLLKISHDTGKCLLVANRIIAENHMENARRLNLQIPYPITVHEFLNHGVSRTVKEEGLLIDDVDMVLRHLLNSNIYAVTGSNITYPERSNDYEKI